MGRGRDMQVDTKDSNYLIKLEHCMLTLFSALALKQVKPRLLP